MDDDFAAEFDRFVEFLDHLDYREPNLDHLKENGLDEIVPGYRATNNQDVLQHYHKHLKRLIKKTSQCLDIFREIYLKKNIEPLEEAFKRLPSELIERTEGGKTRKPFIPSEDLHQKKTQKLLLQILNGDLDDAIHPIDVHVKVMILRQLFLRILKADELSLNEVLPLLWNAEDKLYDNIYWLGMVVGDNGKTINQRIDILNKSYSRQQSERSKQEHYRKLIIAAIKKKITPRVLEDRKRRWTINSINDKIIGELSHEISSGTLTKALKEIFRDKETVQEDLSLLISNG